MHACLLKRAFDQVISFILPRSPCLCKNSCQALNPLNGWWIFRWNEETFFRPVSFVAVLKFVFRLPVQNWSMVVVDVAIVVTSVSLSKLSAVGRSINVDDVVVAFFIRSSGILHWNLSSQNSRNLCKMTQKYFSIKINIDQVILNFPTMDCDDFQKDLKQNSSHRMILLPVSEFWLKLNQLLAVQNFQPHPVCQPIHRNRWWETDLLCLKI